MGLLLALLAVEAAPLPEIAPVATFDLTSWLVSFIPPEALAWIVAHPVWAAVGVYVLSAVLSSIPTTYVFEVPKVGLRIPVGYLVHLCIGNVFQVVRKISPGFAAFMDGLLPGKRADPEALKVSNADPHNEPKPPVTP